MLLRTWRSALGAASIGGALFALSLAPTFAATTTITQVINGGNRTVEVSDPTFSAVTYSNTASQNSDATVTITAEDLTGSNAGWNVTMQQTSALEAGANSIPAENVSLQAYGAIGVVNGQAVDTGGPEIGSTTGALAPTARTVFSADAGFGKGRYTAGATLRIAIPAMQLAGTYSGTLTTTINSGP